MANILLAAQQPGLAAVCFLGIAVVFSGLVILIGLVYLMNYLCDNFIKKEEPKQSEQQNAPVQQSSQIPNREEIVAAVVAAIAEEENTDISAIRVLSFKKV